MGPRHNQRTARRAGSSTTGSHRGAGRGTCRSQPGTRRGGSGTESAERHPILGQVTSLAEARTTVLLDEIVTLVGTDQRLVDPRIRDLGAQDPVLAQTLRAYLDAFGDIGAAARSLQVHPNTVRYRIRRIEQLLSTSLGDPDVRLLFSLGLRAMERTA